MKKFFFGIFAIHSSSRHEKCCQISVRLFSLFRGSIYQQWSATVVDFEKKNQKKIKKWPQYLDWCENVLKLWCEKFQEEGLYLFQGLCLFLNLRNGVIHKSGILWYLKYILKTLHARIKSLTECAILDLVIYLGSLLFWYYFSIRGRSQTTWTRWGR